jgi:hypothetical protein
VNWTYEGRAVLDSDLEGKFGFVYLIINETNGMYYVGKKLLTKASSKMVKKKRKKIRVESDWRTYYGSNKELLADVEKLGEENFTRVILHWCRTKGECSYYEAKEQFQRNVLEDPRSYNQWITCKIHRTHLRRDIPASQRSCEI